MFVWVFAGVGEYLSVYEKCSCYENFGRPWRGEGGFWEHSDNPGQTGEGRSENHDFGRTSFVSTQMGSNLKTFKFFDIIN